MAGKKRGKEIPKARPIHPDNVDSRDLMMSLTRDVRKDMALIYFMAGKNVTEIAQMVGMSVDAIRYYLNESLQGITDISKDILSSLFDHELYRNIKIQQALQRSLLDLFTRLNDAIRKSDNLADTVAGRQSIGSYYLQVCKELTATNKANLDLIGMGVSHYDRGSGKKEPTSVSIPSDLRDFNEGELMSEIKQLSREQQKLVKRYEKRLKSVDSGSSKGATDGGDDG